MSGPPNGHASFHHHESERFDEQGSRRPGPIGADDYVTKPFDPDELLARTRRMLSRTTDADPALDVPLTGRELEVLQLLATGLTQEGIGKELFISSMTVGTHIQRVMTKLGVHSRAEAVALAYRGGFMGAPSQSTE